jgi:hypothetical protein
MRLLVNGFVSSGVGLSSVFDLQIQSGLLLWEHGAGRSRAMSSLGAAGMFLSCVPGAELSCQLAQVFAVVEGGISR